MTDSVVVAAVDRLCCSGTTTTRATPSMPTPSTLSRTSRRRLPAAHHFSRPHHDEPSRPRPISTLPSPSLLPSSPHSPVSVQNQTARQKWLDARGKQTVEQWLDARIHSTEQQDSRSDWLGEVSGDCSLCSATSSEFTADGMEPRKHFSQDGGTGEMPRPNEEMCCPTLRDASCSQSDAPLHHNQGPALPSRALCEPEQEIEELRRTSEKSKNFGT